MNLENIKIEKKNGEMVVSSREVAENFKKEHSKVIRSIENLIENEPTQNWLRYFIPNEYKDLKGEMRKEFLITEKGFSLLVMGFTGKSALEWKLKYIDAFDEMRQYIEQQPKAVPRNYKEALQQLIVSEEEKEKLQDTVKNLQPKVEFAEAIVSNEKSIDVGSMAKILYQNGIDVGRNRLFGILRENGFLMSSGEDTVPTQKSMNLGIMETKLGNYPINGETKTYLKPMITTKGQVYFISKFMKGELA